MKRVALALLIGLVICSASYSADNFSYVDIISRLTDLEHLATLPDAGEKCQQFSSYDRRSEYDEENGKYVQWYANGDGDGFIRKEGEDFVLAEMQGPGVIWRIWSALLKEGHVKIYLDGNEKPTVDLPFVGYFNRKNAPFDRSALVYESAKGFNCYVPMPFQKSCKIVAEKDWGKYFHFTYTTFPKGTKVPTFKRQLSEAESVALDEANEFLANCGRDPAGERKGQKTNQITVTIAAGERATVAQINGKRAITAIKVKTFLPGDEQDYNLLRQMTISINFDDEKSASVWSPLGDFFGNAAGKQLYKSLPMGATEDGFYSYWYMPFARKAVVKIANESDKPQKLVFTVTHSPLKKSIKKLGRFHAKWHRNLSAGFDRDRWPDWMLLKTTGKGRLCGVMMHIWSPIGWYLEVEWCSGHWWWGEGDEKFFVDGEKFPSTYGTGTEDYFGYAWCNPGVFHRAYHNQTINENNAGNVCVSRWHIGDNIPFQKSFEATIEKYYPDDYQTLYAATVYWYQDAGSEDIYSEVPVEERIGYFTKKVSNKVKGVIEGEDFEVVSKSAGNLTHQELGSRFSGGKHLWWTGAKPGDILVLASNVDKGGSYKVKAQLTKAVDYAIVQLYGDGEKLGEPIDLYNNGVVLTGEIDLGTFSIEAGKHQLEIEIVGANEKAAKAYMFGLDYIKVEKVN